MTYLLPWYFCQRPQHSLCQLRFLFRRSNEEDSETQKQRSDPHRSVNMFTKCCRQIVQLVELVFVPLKLQQADTKRQQKGPCPDHVWVISKNSTRQSRQFFLLFSTRRQIVLSNSLLRATDLRFSAVRHCQLWRNPESGRTDSHAKLIRSLTWVSWTWGREFFTAANSSCSALFSEQGGTQWQRNCMLDQMSLKAQVTNALTHFQSASGEATRRNFLARWGCQPKIHCWAAHT